MVTAARGTSGQRAPCSGEMGRKQQVAADATGLRALCAGMDALEHSPAPAKVPSMFIYRRAWRSCPKLWCPRMYFQASHATGGTATSPIISPGTEKTPDWVLKKNPACATLSAARGCEIQARPPALRTSLLTKVLCCCSGPPPPVHHHDLSPNCSSCAQPIVPCPAERRRNAGSRGATSGWLGMPLVWLQAGLPAATGSMDGLPASRAFPCCRRLSRWRAARAPGCSA